MLEDTPPFILRSPLQLITGKKLFYCWEFLKHNFPAKNSVPPLIRIAGIPRWKEAHSPVRVNSFFLIFLPHTVCGTFLWCFGLWGAPILLEQCENKFPISLPHTVCPKPQTHLISSHYILILHCFLCNLCRPQGHSVCAQNKIYFGRIHNKPLYKGLFGI